MKLIDKDAVVAEIKRRKEINKYRDTNDSLFEDEAILSFINTIEVKEIDLDREIRRYRMRNPIIQHRKGFEDGVASVNVKAHELVLIDVDSVRDDFMAEIYRILDGDPTNDRANAIINAFDSLPTVSLQHSVKTSNTGDNEI